MSFAKTTKQPNNPSIFGTTSSVGQMSFKQMREMSQNATIRTDIDTAKPSLRKNR